MRATFLSGIYCGPAPVPSEIWLRWNLDPVLLVGLVLLAFSLRRSTTGQAAVAALFVIFVSPFCALSAALFSARVVHHLLLMALAAPLFAMAWPVRKPLNPTTAFLISTIVLWAWHLPLVYDLALSNKAIYWVMQFTLLGAAVLFWQSAFKQGENLGPALLLIFGGYLQMAFLGALLTFAPEPLYAIHVVAPLSWGFSPLGDQQLGGLIMWVPSGIPFVLFGGLMAYGQWQALARRST
ncbi:cytochrome c oxidase assembly protein [Neorhizobium petrolearium]|uniref:cytochrome c oxidase assembly protein n=1 Tax=Neorhizobium petrolearium TaxID=515361 RepID=UPI003F172359